MKNFERANVAFSMGDLQNSIRFLLLHFQEQKGIHFGEWQLCPKCHGQGIVSRPPWVPFDQEKWSSTGITYSCDVCNGAKMIGKPIINNEVVEQEEQEITFVQGLDEDTNVLNPDNQNREKPWCASVIDRLTD